jgi:hypothetical protein
MSKKFKIKQKLLMTASANALKLATHYKDPMVSYLNRTTPSMCCNNKLPLLLRKAHNMLLPYRKWLELNFVQTLMSRQD